MGAGSNLLNVRARIFERFGETAHTTDESMAAALIHYKHAA
jgi:hypothetical protein